MPSSSNSRHLLPTKSTQVWLLISKLLLIGQLVSILIVVPTFSLMLPASSSFSNDHYVSLGNIISSVDRDDPFTETKMIDFKQTKDIQSKFNYPPKTETLISSARSFEENDPVSVKLVAQNAPQSSTQEESQPSGSSSLQPNLDELDNLDDEFCKITTVARRSLIMTTTSPSSRSKYIEIHERSLFCSNINEFNYRQVVKNIYRRQNKLNIQQIHLTNSGSLVVFSAIDLICDRFDCSRLTVFNVSGQEIHDCNVLSTWLASWSQLEVLDLSDTSLKSIDSIFSPVDTKSPIVMKNLTHLYLNTNNITELNFNSLLEKLPNLRQLSIINNSINNISCSEGQRARIRSQFETINLAGNAINCDRSQLWFMKQFQSPITNLKFPDHNQINCSYPERLIEMTWAQRVSVLETKICDDCDCKSLKRTAISVDCHNKNLTALPDVLPLNTKILNLTSNHINSLVVPQNSQNWENVTYVYLENNLISSFQPLEVNSKFMRNLAALDIRRNKFQEFPSHIFEQFINLDQVHLSDNPWICDCESTYAFQEWLQRQFHKVGDKEEIRCGVFGSERNGLKSNNLQQRLSSRVIYRLSKSELCPQDNLEEPYDWLDVANLTMSILIILIVLKVILDYSYQHRTKRLPHFFKLNH